MLVRPFGPPVARFAASALALALTACEPRIEEPLPPPSDGTPTETPIRAALTASGTSTAITTSASTLASSASVAPRCIHPTPSAPARAVNIKEKVDPRCPADPSRPAKLREGRLSFVGAAAATGAAKPATPIVTVEIADKDDDRMRGLMFRRAMDEDRGMIFVFDDKADHTFWMKNTCIPLDMLFVDDDGTIVGIEENTTTLSEQTFSVGCKSKYVVEVNAGWSRRHGVVAGQKIAMEL